MNKRKVRCYIAYSDAGGIYNNEVMYTVSDGYRLELAICINCATLFVVDYENPHIAGRSLHHLVNGVICPECGRNLQSTLREYPKTFVGKGGYIGTFTPPHIIPPEINSRVVDLWEITTVDP